MLKKLFLLTALLAHVNCSPVRVTVSEREDGQLKYASGQPNGFLGDVKDACGSGYQLMWGNRSWPFVIVFYGYLLVKLSKLNKASRIDFPRTVRAGYALYALAEEEAVPLSAVYAAAAPVPPSRSAQIAEVVEKVAATIPAVAADSRDLLSRVCGEVVVDICNRWQDVKNFLEIGTPQK